MSTQFHPVIELKCLSIGYISRKHKKTIASGINATLWSGELACLVGANGVGKSTLLRTLSAFLPKLSGEIEIAGRSIDNYSEKELAKTIGVVLTEKVDARDTSVRDLVAMGRSPYTGFWGKLNEEDQTCVDNAIRAVQIENLSERAVQTLSDGERQKVMIAKTLTQETPIIILDEPTAFLDYPSKVDIMQLLSRLSHETGKTIFLSTHDLELALQLSDKLWLMDRNRGITVGSADELAKDGSLDNFFDNESIVFDRETVRYEIVKQPIGGK